MSRRLIRCPVCADAGDDRAWSRWDGATYTCATGHELNENGEPIPPQPLTVSFGTRPLYLLV